ncbi:MAG: enolase [Candidatus Nanohaloarchaeota archaeon QJJ-5]|nr:enolase [Candidatus Nanohaloarchaeota archaeon QJJ-5]
MEIDDLGLYRVFDSRADETVAASVNGVTAAAPAGASRGTHEAASFVPDDLESIEATIRDHCIGDSFDQASFDDLLEDIDGTDQFANIGSVAIALSLAFRKATEANEGKTFPYPLGNVVGGGEHGGNTAIQEFLLLPIEAQSFEEAARTNARIYDDLKEQYARKISGINDEGALITTMDDEQTLQAVTSVASDHGARVGLDVAGNELWTGEVYEYSEMGLRLSPKEQQAFMEDLIDRFDLAYVEDPFHEDDFRHHKDLQDNVNDTLIVGDDLYATNAARLRGDGPMCDGTIIKPNQAGTVTRTREAISVCRDAETVPIISHRSGETCDPSISMMALMDTIPIIKAGITDIRVAKLNWLRRQWQKTESSSMASVPISGGE